MFYAFILTLFLSMISFAEEQYPVGQRYAHLADNDNKILATFDRVDKKIEIIGDRDLIMWSLFSRAEQLEQMLASKTNKFNEEMAKCKPAVPTKKVKK